MPGIEPHPGAYFHAVLIRTHVHELPIVATPLLIHQCLHRGMRPFHARILHAVRHDDHDHRPWTRRLRHRSQVGIRIQDQPGHRVQKGRHAPRFQVQAGNLLHGDALVYPLVFGIELRQGHLARAPGPRLLFNECGKPAFHVILDRLHGPGTVLNRSGVSGDSDCWEGWSHGSKHVEAESG